MHSFKSSFVWGICPPARKARVEHQLTTMCMRYTRAATPQDCFLSESRVLTIATAFGITIFVTVFAAASFSGAHTCPFASH